MGLALQVAQHHRLTVLLGQALKFFLQDGMQVILEPFAFGFRCGLVRAVQDDLAATACRAFARQGDAKGNAMQPGAYRGSAAQRAGFASEDQEGGLEGILGILLVGQHAPTHSEYHWPVAFDQQRERLLVAPEETSEQCRVVGSVRPPAVENAADAIEELLEIMAAHTARPGPCELSI